MGGEKIAEAWLCAVSSGSPPRGRGKEGTENIARTLAGITPAWAGKREVFGYQEAWAEDHPRVGGEKGGKTALMVGQLGSPPRGRGKVLSAAGKSPLPRITPAWAGKSSPRFCTAPPAQDHPRVGGEKDHKETV